MTTIYEHNVTDGEIKELRRLIPGRDIADQNDYEKKMSDDLKYADLFRLYSIRGKRKEALFYLSKIKDSTLKYLLE